MANPCPYAWKSLAEARLSTKFLAAVAAAGNICVIVVSDMHERESDCD